MNPDLCKEVASACVQQLSFSDLFSAAANIFNGLVPLFSIIVGMFIGVNLFHFVITRMRAAFGDDLYPPSTTVYEKPKNQEIAIEKRKNDWQYLEEKPKRGRHLVFGDDGEIIPASDGSMFHSNEESSNGQD